MLSKNVVQNFCPKMWSKNVDQKCCPKILSKNVVKKCCPKTWSKISSTNVVQNVVQKCIQKCRPKMSSRVWPWPCIYVFFISWMSFWPVKLHSNTLLQLQQCTFKCRTHITVILRVMTFKWSSYAGLQNLVFGLASYF